MQKLVRADDRALIIETDRIMQASLHRPNEAEFWEPFIADSRSRYFAQGLAHVGAMRIGNFLQIHSCSQVLAALSEQNMASGDLGKRPPFVTEDQREAGDNPAKGRQNFALQKALESLRKM